MSELTNKLEVFFYEAFAEEEAALREHLDPAINAGFAWETIQETDHVSPPAPLISTRTQSVLPPAWADQLDGILSRSTGYDHLTAYRAKSGVDVACGYLPLYCARAVAEQAAMLWMSLLRKLPLQVKNFRSFSRDGLTGVECAGGMLLVVGVGDIGHEVVRIGSGLDMHVLGVDLEHRHADVEYVPIEQGIAEADVIVCAMNLTGDNHGYFTRELLARAPRGAVLVNISRGELTPSEVLLELLESGHLGGAALDVFDHESDLADCLRGGANGKRSASVRATLAMAEHPNVILTPHNAFNTAEAVARKSADSAVQCQRFLETGAFRWPVPVEGSPTTPTGAAHDA